MHRTNYWKRPWCWERLRARGEGDDRGWDGWMASLTQQTWVWASSGRWWRTGKPGMLQSMGMQRVRHDLVTEQQQWNQIRPQRAEAILKKKMHGITLYDFKLYYKSHSNSKSQIIRKGLDAGKDWRQEQKGMTEDEMVGWHHWLNGHEFEQALVGGEGQGSLGCCSPWGCE